MTYSPLSLQNLNNWLYSHHNLKSLKIFFIVICYQIFKWPYCFVIKATYSYVSDIRQRIGNSAFTSLFDMGDSSALAIILDVTGSMQNEIDAVKKEIIEIVTVSKMNQH